MKSLCIKTNNNKAIDYLLDNLNKIDLKDVYFSCHKFSIYNNIFIHYKGLDENLFFNSISNILSFLVLDIYEDSITRNILQKEYFYFDKFEQNVVLDKFYENRLENIEDFEVKENILFEAFYGFFKNCKSNVCCKLYLKGFITFRLKKYIDELETEIDSSVNQYLVEKEYQEFVSLLKIYVNSEGYNSDFVHLIYRNSSKNIDSVLLDKNRNVIDTSIYLLGAKYLSDISFSSSDMILNTLLNLLPKRIFIHLEDIDDEDEFVCTLEAIFEGRVVVCLDVDIGVKK